MPTFQPSKYQSFNDIKKESPFWRRLNDSNAEEHVRQLQVTIERVATEAFATAKTIIRWMPTYTLHDERHLLNLIAWMERLTPDATLKKLTPLEIGLCFLAAFTHDLGMNLPNEERSQIATKDTPEQQAFARHAERFPELLHRKKHLAKSRADLARRIDDFLLCDYLRATHATKSGDRINDWLESMKSHGVLFQYDTVDYQHELKLIAASHNQPVGWLRHELEKFHGSFYRLVRTSEYVNFALPGLLLRLADIMDFDRSRTPSILYQHLGLDEAISIHWTKARQEWSKHLAVTGIDFENDKLLKYVAGSCPSPVIEKSIHQFVGWIHDEVLGIGEEMRQQSLKIREDNDDKSYDCPLALPNKVIAKVTPQRTNGQPIYTYHDLQFALDHDEIMQLLMGEKLYGDPGLCIRELLQNALDAVELREKRLQLQDKGGQPSEPVDGVWHEPGFFKHNGPKQQLEVKLSWGHDSSSGQEWICVEDNGIGMTLDVLKQFFTRVGKSYYRSGEFRLEQNRMREHGLLFSPISQFGIGFLSCFMLADRVEVRTHPGGNRPAHDVILSGPGNLFWIKPGARAKQGTEVKLFLKRKFKLRHDPDKWLLRLRIAFGYIDGHESVGEDHHFIDPAFLAARCVFWPCHRIVLNAAEEIVIDDHFHMNKLVPIDVNKVHTKMRQWSIANVQAGEPHWSHWDWEDNKREGATGTRIRLWFPCNHKGEPLCDPPANSGLISQGLLASLVEEQLVKLKKDSWRKLLVRGMYVEELRRGVIAEIVLSHIGTHVWIDLRGSATPQLSADRLKATPPDETGEMWSIYLRGILTCWQDAVRNQFIEYPAIRNLLLGYSPIVDEISTDVGAPSFPQNILAMGLNFDLRSLQLTQMAFHQYIAFGCKRDNNLQYLPTSEDSMHNQARCLLPDIDHDEDRLVGRPNEYRELARARTRLRDRGFVRTLAHGIGREPHLHESFVQSDNALDWNRQITEENADRVVFRNNITIDYHVMVAFLQEAFFPDLRHSWPWLGLFPLRGMVGNGLLIGPSIIDFTFDRDGRTVRYTDQHGTPSSQVRANDYDLVFPLSVIPLGVLRQKCGAWRDERGPRRLGVLPFLLPSANHFAESDLPKLREYFRVDRIYALLPRFELWAKRFEDWTQTEWAHRENFSALWDLKKGVVLWAKSTGNLDWIRENGQPPERFFAVNKTPGTTTQPQQPKRKKRRKK